MRLNEWIEVASFEHQGSVNTIMWAPSEIGLKLAAGSADGCVSILSRKSKIQRENFGIRVIIADESWEKPYKFQAHDLGISSVGWAPYYTPDDFDGETNIEQLNLLPKLVTASCDKTVKIWEYRASRFFTRVFL
mgnify:FL=1